MGGRGAFDKNMGRTGGVPKGKREYSEIGKIGRIKIIQCDTKDNNPTPHLLQHGKYNLLFI